MLPFTFSARVQSPHLNSGSQQYTSGASLPSQTLQDEYLIFIIAAL